MQGRVKGPKTVTPIIGYIFLGARPFSEEAIIFSRQQCNFVVNEQLALQQRALPRVSAAIAVGHCAVVHHCNFAVICHRLLDNMLGSIVCIGDFIVTSPLIGLIPVW